MTVRGCTGLACGALILLGPARALAHGDFPDGMQLLLPRDSPNEMVAAMNFGLVISRPQGEEIRLACEESVGTLPNLYRMGAPPANRIFAIGLQGLLVSSDKGCAWTNAPSDTPAALATDVYPDPIDAEHVLVVSATSSPQGVVYHLHRSKDGGSTFRRIPAVRCPAAVSLDGRGPA